MIIPLERIARIVDDNGYLTLRAATYLEELTRAINLNSPIFGTGPPEGVVKADLTQRYIDTTSSGSGLYVKKSGDNGTSTGWVLV